MTTAEATTVTTRKYGMSNRLLFAKQLKELLLQLQLGKALFTHHHPLLIHFYDKGDGDFILSALEPPVNTSIALAQENGWTLRERLDPMPKPEAIYYVTRRNEQTPVTDAIVASYTLPKHIVRPEYLMERPFQFDPDLHRLITSITPLN